MRRVADVVAAVVAGVVLLLPGLLIALLIRLRLGSPVLFWQSRSGLDGAEFRICKFRTMRDEAYPGEPDPDRLPRLGRLLRTASLDEIPQIWNVLRGEMSVIGPRPTLPEQVRHYSERQRRRLTVRPGITGWAQVNGRNSLSWPERIELDLWYIEHRSLRLDLRILVLTVLRWLRPEGVTAEGGVNPGFPVPGGDEPPARSAAPGSAASG
ncbi:MAG TPA: sugar transferase [Actinomycetales bacterium]|nr:sugar transferase [Actinomycetales bacterium]